MTHRLTTGMAAMEPRFVMWRRVRLPLAVAGVVIIVIVSALLLRSMLVDRGIRRDLARLVELIALDSVESHEEARDTIGALAQAHPGRTSVVTRDAWHKVLGELRFDATEERKAATKRAVEEAAALGNDPFAVAVQAGYLLTQGDSEGALSKLGTKVSLREEVFVTAMAFRAQGKADQAIELFDRARQGVPPYVPALAEMARLLRQRGRLEEARAAVKVLVQVSPDHQDGVVEEVLLALDKPGPEPTAATQQKLLKRLNALDVPDDRPRAQAFRNQGLGRLALLGGEPQKAVTWLAQSARILEDNQAVATWLARAYRQIGDHGKALEAISAFPDDGSSTESLLQTRAALLLDLHRSETAAAPLRVLSQTGTAVARLMEGRRLLQAGSPRKATAVLRQAVGQGSTEAVLYLSHALIDAGRADRANATLRNAGDSGSLGSCASGFSYSILGNAERAAKAFDEATAAGAPCGATLKGQLLLESGGSAGLVPALEAALAKNSDLLDQVTLARVRFREEGAETAQAELNRVRALNPEGPKLLRALALAYREVGEPAQGLAVARGAIKSTKGHPLVVGAAAELALDLQKARLAQNLLGNAPQKHEFLPYVDVQRARFQLSQSRLSDAKATIEKALRPGPWYGQAACVAGEISLRVDGAEKALRTLQRMAASARRGAGSLVDARIRGCLFDLYLRRGPSMKNRAKGVVYFLRRMPLRWSGAAFMAGQLAEREGKRGDAREYYREALALNPGERAAWLRLFRAGEVTPEETRKYRTMWPDGPTSQE